MKIARGRPRLTPELYQERVEAYCSRYRVAPLDSGLPPFPTGQRETPQHKEWIALYKAHSRIAARGGPSAEDRRALLQAQDGRCPVCWEPVSASDPVHGSKAILHQRCHQLAGLAEALGPPTLDRLRAYLWPPSRKKRSP